MNIASPTSSFEVVLIRLSVATVIGCLVGLNRELYGKPAGMRTHGSSPWAPLSLTLASLDLAGKDPSAVLRTIRASWRASASSAPASFCATTPPTASTASPPPPRSGWWPPLASPAVPGQWAISTIAVALTLVLLNPREKLEQKLR